MSTGSIDAGDEVAVGPCRIFLLRVDDGPVAAGRPARARPPRKAGRWSCRRRSRRPARPEDDGPVRRCRRPEPGSRSRYVRPGDLPAEKPDWARTEIAAGEPSVPASA